MILAASWRTHQGAGVEHAHLGGRGCSYWSSVIWLTLCWRKVVPDAAESDSAVVCFRRSTGPEDVRPWRKADVQSLVSASPWRTFRWHKGQRHYSAPTGHPPTGIMSSTSPGWSWPVCCSPTSTSRGIRGDRVKQLAGGRDAEPAVALLDDGEDPAAGVPREHHFVPRLGVLLRQGWP